MNAVSCPRCHNQLRVAPDAGRWLTCPRCLASVGNPADFAVTTETRPESAPHRDEPPVETDVCPECGKDVQPRWRLCPFCSAVLRRRELSIMRPVEDDVRPDSKGTVVGICLLGGLSVAGVVVLLWLGTGLADFAGLSWVLYLGIGVVLVVAAGCGLLAYLGRGRAGTSASLVAGASTITGLVMALLVFLLLSACVVFVFTCGKGASSTAPSTAPRPAPPTSQPSK